MVRSLGLGVYYYNEVAPENRLHETGEAEEAVHEPETWDCHSIDFQIHENFHDVRSAMNSTN